MSYQKRLRWTIGMTLAALLLAGCAGTSTPPPTTTEYTLQFDGEPDQVQSPISIALDQQGNLD